MGWIVGIKKGIGELVFDEQVKDSVRTVSFDKTALQTGGRLPGVQKRTGLFQVLLCDLKPTKLTDVLPTLGVPGGVVETQVIYEHEHDGRRLLIPSQLLIGALYCTNAYLRKYAMTPAGVGMFAAAVDDGGPSLDVEVTEWQNWQIPFSDFHKDLLLWMLCYPSARRMTSSLFAKALQGKLDFVLPKAEASISVRGPVVNGFLIAETLFVEWVRTAEAPLDGLAGRVPAHVQFKRHKTPNQSRTHKSGRQFAESEVPADGPWKLSDNEWRQLCEGYRAMVRAPREGMRLTEDQRQMIEEILRKYKEGISWRKACGSEARASTAKATKAAYNRSGNGPVRNFVFRA